MSTGTDEPGSAPVLRADEGLPVDLSPNDLMERVREGARIQVRHGRGRALLATGVGAVMTFLLGRIVWSMIEIVPLLVRRGYTLETALLTPLAVLMSLLCLSGLRLAAFGLGQLLWSPVAWELGPDGITDRHRPGRAHLYSWDDILGADRVDNAISLGVRDGVARPAGIVQRWVDRWRPTGLSGELLSGGTVSDEVLDALVDVIEAGAGDQDPTAGSPVGRDR